MKKLKILLGVVGVILALLIGVVVVAFVAIDQVAKQGVERGATYALDVPTTLDGADVDIFGGAVGLAGLTIANPEGYDTPHFLSLGSADAAVDLATLQEDTVEVPALIIDGIDIYLDKEDGKANYDVILDNLKRFEKASDPDAPEAPPAAEDPDAPKKKFVIRKIEVRNVTAHVEFVPLAGDLARTTVTVPEIILEDVGEKDPVTIAKLTNVLIKAIFASVISVGSDVLPAGVIDGLNAGLGGLTDLASSGIGMGIDVGEGVVNIVGDVGGVAVGAAGDVLKGAGGLAGDAASEVGDAAGDAIKGVGGLLGLGNDKDKDETEDEGNDASESDRPAQDDPTESGDKPEG
ncbi:MAG: AsmA family protein [Planctomycetota bacterium]